MAKGSKNRDSRSTSTIDIGKERKVRIGKYRAQMELKGTPITTIDEAIRRLCDEALDRHGIAA